MFKVFLDCRDVLEKTKSTNNADRLSTDPTGNVRKEALFCIGLTAKI
jgi:hypothetical protein